MVPFFNNFESDRSPVFGAPSFTKTFLVIPSESPKEHALRDEGSRDLPGIISCSHFAARMPRAANPEPRAHSFGAPKFSNSTRSEIRDPRFKIKMVFGDPYFFNLQKGSWPILHARVNQS